MKGRLFVNCLGCWGLWMELMRISLDLKRNRRLLLRHRLRGVHRRDWRFVVGEVGKRRRRKSKMSRQ